MEDNERSKLELVGDRLMSLRFQIESMTPRGEDRSHLFGEVALAVLSQVDRIDMKSPQRLIRRIARNKRIDMIRRSKLRNHRSLESLPIPLAARSRSASSLDDLIAHLSCDDRGLLQARFRDNKSWSEIADETSCCEATIRSRWHRLKQRLAQHDALRDAAHNWE